jgi:hypothetical protein
MVVISGRLHRNEAEGEGGGLLAIDRPRRLSAQHDQGALHRTRGSADRAGLRHADDQFQARGVRRRFDGEQGEFGQMGRPGGVQGALDLRAQLQGLAIGVSVGFVGIEVGPEPRVAIIGVRLSAQFTVRAGYAP